MSSPMWLLNVRLVFFGSFGLFRGVCSLDRVAKTIKLVGVENCISLEPLVENLSSHFLS
ncbi:hypothetical protein ISN45_At02g018840 [Arabidopsis thaliana x Arabidopsis arenosa]|uniref:Uncharacterized protein n=2 Tax=Arabidopsis TaxID=3701 RepID=A0A8T2G5F5_ARASU|nr:hypothetical protein ISN45_At02g018840 [Arabidopsis thaliana x Arabidopsis arenosa]KAG7641953.1 hypothetical protein ISN44_As02g019230 [Arabidopsis suecica]